MPEINNLHEGFIIDTEEMKNSVMSRGQHRSKLARIGSRIKEATISLASFMSIVSMAGNNNILVIDISYWQDDQLIDYEELSKHIDGVILRGVYGIWEDTRLRIHYQNFKKYGVPVGSYAYVVGNLSGHEQAEKFYEAVSSLDLQIEAWADIEDTRSGTHLTRRVVDDFLTRCDALFGSQTPIYTGPYAWQSIMGNIDAYNDRKLWIANYGVTSPMLPIGGGWDKWWLWQHTSNGRHPGYPSGLDSNRFYGTDAEYKNWAGVSEIPVPQPPDEEELGDPLFRAMCIAEVGLFVRDSIGGNRVGALVNGEIANVYKVENGWFQIGVDEWCSGSEKYMEILDEPVEPPVEPPVVVDPEDWQAGYSMLKERIEAVEKDIENIKQIINS